MGIRNATHKTGGTSQPLKSVAFTEPVPSDRGKAAKTGRISRVGSTTRVSGSGSAK
jgi:hypothetical protein